MNVRIIPVDPEARKRVVTEAQSWLKTPYVTGGQVKGAGADCATLLYCVYRNCGFVPADGIEVFSPDAWCHWTEEKYKFRVLRHAKQIAEGVANGSLRAEPGNILLLRTSNSRVYNHGGIIVQWPTIIHAVEPRVEEANLLLHPLWAFQKIAIFDPFSYAG